MQVTRHKSALGPSARRRALLLAAVPILVATALHVTWDGAAVPRRLSSPSLTLPSSSGVSASPRPEHVAIALSLAETEWHAQRIASIRKLCRQPDSADRDACLRVLFAELAATDIDEAFALAQEVLATTGESSRIDIYGVILDTVVASRHPLDALTLVARVPDSEIHWNLSQRIVLAWAERSPRAAKEWIDGLTEGFARDHLLLELGQKYAEREPVRAVSMAREISNAALRRSAVSSALAEWFRHDPRRSTEWLSGTPPHPDLDHAAAAIASLPTLVPTRTDVALGWAESIVDEQIRDATLADIVRAWTTTDAGAAARYVAGSPHLSAARKSELKNWIARTTAHRSDFTPPTD